MMIAYSLIDGLYIHIYHHTAPLLQLLLKRADQIYLYSIYVDRLADSLYMRLYKPYRASVTGVTETGRSNIPI